MGFFIQKIVIGLVIVSAIYGLWNLFRKDEPEKNDNDDSWDEF
jgi:hypothetical protein